MSNTLVSIILSSSSISNPPPLPKHPPSTITNPTPKHSHHRPLLTTVHFPKHPHKQNTNYYAQLASKLAEEAKFNDFFMIVETGLVSLVESGELRKLVSVLGGFEKLGIKGLVGGLVCEGAVFDAVRRECRKGLKCGELEVVLDLLEVLSEDVLEPVEVIRTCFYKKNSCAAIRYAGLCTRSDEIFCKAILEFGKRGDMASARTVYSDMELWDHRFIRVHPSIGIDEKRGKVYADARMWQMALGMKDKMVEAGVTPNAVTWSSLISACAKAGLVDQALVLFEEMLLAGCMPNSQCCNVLLYACVQAFQYDRAFRLFHSWKSNSFQITNRSLTQGSSQVVPMKVPFKPTTATYNVLMKACGTDHFLAKALMEEMETVGLS
ncbi:pentatricopeptide repeat-containing protein [Tanacetum coccineum]